MADAPSGDLRTSILAELAATASPAAAPAEPASDVATDSPAPEDEQPEGESDVAVEASADESTETDEAGPEDDAPDDEAELETDADPKVAKGLDKVRFAEKRFREAAERREAEFAAREQKHQQRLERADEIDRLAARIKYDPVAVLRALGASDDDLVTIAQASYAESPEGQKDPARKAAATAALKERERLDKLTATERRLADLEAKIDAQKQEAAAQAEAVAYIQQINTAASAKYPLVAHMLKADAETTQDGLVAAYDRLAAKLQRPPQPGEVVAEYDKRERARLQKLGVDPASIVKAPGKPAAPAPTKTAAKQTAAAKPAANGNAPKPAPKSDIELRDEIVAELASLS